MFIRRLFSYMMIVSCVTSVTLAAPPYHDRTFDSRVFGEKRNYRIFLPSEYENGQERFPVIYYLHGHSDRYTLEKYDQGTDTVPKISDFVSKHDVIVVTVDGYVKEHYSGFYGGSPWDVRVDGGDYDFGEYFQEMVGHVDETYRTRPGRRYRATSGLSMGGFMSLYLSARYPQLIGSASSFNSGPEFYVGDKGRRALWRPKDHVSNHEQTMVRLVRASGDYISQYHEETHAAYANAHKVQYEYRRDEYHRHWATSIAETFAFHSRAFDNPKLEQTPDTWSHASADREFSVWGYEVHVDGEGRGITYLTDVRRNGMRVATRRWAPDGPAIQDRQITIVTSPHYDAGKQYIIADYGLATHHRTETVSQADDAGRITLHCDGDGHHISITGPGVEAHSPELLPVTTKGKLRVWPARNLSLPLRIYNPSLTTMKNVKIVLSSEYPTVLWHDDSATVPVLEPGEVADVSASVSVRFTSGDGYFAPTRLGYRLSAEGTPTVAEPIDVLIVPEVVRRPEKIEILDGRSMTFQVFRQKGNQGGGKSIERTVTEGKGNGNGVIEPGEEATIWVQMAQGIDPFDKSNWYRCKVYCDSPWLEEVGDIQETKQLEWTGAQERTSTIRLAKDTPPGEKIHLLLDNETWSYHFTPDVRYGKEPLYQAFQRHRHHLHRCVIPQSVPASVARVGSSAEVPRNLRVVLENTKPLKFDRRGHLPLLVLPISNSLAKIGDEQTERLLRELDRRGIGYTVDWDPSNFDKSLEEGLRIARLQIKLRLRVCVNANACLHSFFDGTEETLHIDRAGKTFAETSFGGKLGCPFAIQHRVPVIKERIEKFLRAYKQAGVKIDFLFADWEIDGPIEWNDAWATSKRCERCRRRITNIDDFRAFQIALREVRSDIQRVAFGDNVTEYFSEALVGNYGVYPHGGHRYWYDYFERETPGAPFQLDQRAHYREWAHEFKTTGYTFAMPVVYTWYPTFQWYDFDVPDYRWFYNMLLVGSNAGQHTPARTPVISFVHWTTTAPPEKPDSKVLQFSEDKYRELLWHLLLRGHDTFFLWCVADELPDEIRMVHEVYAEAMAYRGFLDRGTPVSFDVPRQPGPVVSGLRLGDRVLVRRTDFGESEAEPLSLQLADGGEVVVPAQAGLHVLQVQSRSRHRGLLSIRGKWKFPIGIYEMPADESDLKDMAASGINLVRCGNRKDLDRAHAMGMKGWLPLGVQQGATTALREQIESVVDHPALGIWEGPDEIVWTFTAHSFLAKSAGFTRDDWNAQASKAVAYSNRKGAEVIRKMREGIALVRELDKHKRPFWMNEAADSDVTFVRQYIDSVDIVGCDYYAVRSTGTDLQSVGRLVDRWDAIGRGRPVWMVLQAFSWHVADRGRERLYPSFGESRFMAYDSIAHGARGILYWGSSEIDDPDFRHSVYALTSELSALEPFLVGENHDRVRANVIDDLFDPPGRGVRAKLFRHGSDYLLILVNEDSQRHLGVDVSGLEMIQGRELSLLYGSETATVRNGGISTRLQGYEVKLFATSSRCKSSRTRGRDYPAN